jgi:hypothetical protein
MKFFHPLLIALLSGSFGAWSAPAQKTGARGVVRAEFQGWPESVVLNARSTDVKAIVVPGVGGRVMSYGLGGDNILWVNPATAGWTLATHPEPFQPGGFQCDIGPSVAGWPAHPSSWVGPYDWSAKRNYLVTLHAPKEEVLRVELEKEIQLDPATGDIGFVHRMKNVGELDSAYCLWHRVACRPRGFVLMSLNPKSRFPAGWSQRREIQGKPGYDGDQPSSAAVRLLDGILVAQTGGGGTTIGTDSMSQWLAYVVGRTLFVLHFPTYSSGVYSEGGNSVAVTWNDEQTELQAFSPEARLRPRKTYEFPMKWTLIQLPTEPKTHEEARALVARIPSSPFL